MGRFIDGSQTSTVLANNPANCFSASCTFVFSSTEVMAAVRLDIVCHARAHDPNTGKYRVGEV